MPSLGRTYEMETSWQLFCAKNGGGSHTIVYNTMFLAILLYFLGAPWCNVYSYTSRLSLRSGKVRLNYGERISGNTRLAIRKLHTKFIA